MEDIRFDVATVLILITALLDIGVHILARWLRLALRGAQLFSG